MQKQQLLMELNLINAELATSKERLVNNEMSFHEVMILKRRRWVLKGMVKYSFLRANLE